MHDDKLLKEAITADEVFALSVEQLHAMGITKIGQVDKFLKEKKAVEGRTLEFGRYKIIPCIKYL